MINVIRSESVKLLTTRMWWGLLLGAVALVALNVVPTALFAGQSFGPGAPAVPPLEELAGLTAVYGAGYQAGYLMTLVLGVIIGAADLRHRTATQTFLATPAGGRVVVAKMVVAAVAGLCYGVVTQLATILAAAPVLLSRDVGFGLGEEQVLRSLVLGVPGIALWGVVGTGLGILLRNQIAAVLVAVAYVFVGDLLVSGLLSLVNLDAAVSYTPNNASTAIVEGFTGFELLTWWAGALVLLGYGVLVALLGWVIGRRRDIA